MGLTALLLMAAMAGSPDLSWLAGHWLMCGPKGETAEVWTDDRGGVMLGLSKTVGPRGTSWEASRIETIDGVPTFFASPKGQPPARFAMLASGERTISFENKAHDYPHRVIYRREGETLIGRIEGEIGGKARASEWRYNAAPLNARCPAKP